MSPAVSTLVVPQGFSYVLASATSSLWLLVWQTLRVGGARKKAGIRYPQLYAEKAEAAASKDVMKFNCTQRAHQNTLESLPIFLLSTLIAGLKYPYLASGLAFVWVLGRVLFTIGYSTGDPSKRNSRGGFISNIGLLGLAVSSTYTIYGFIREGL